MRMDRWKDDESTPEGDFTPFRFDKQPSNVPASESQPEVSYFNRIVTLAPLAFGIWVLYRAIPRLLDDPFGRFIGFAVLIVIFSIVTLLFWAILGEIGWIDGEILALIANVTIGPILYLQRLRFPTDEEWKSIESLSGADYYSYLESDEWKQRREYMLRRAGFRCQICNRKGRLEVHHRTYRRLGEERPDDLTVLCGDCHELFHSHRRLDR